jgi:hypothetical protein
MNHLRHLTRVYAPALATCGLATLPYFSCSGPRFAPDAQPFIAGQSKTVDFAAPVVHIVDSRKSFGNKLETACSGVLIHKQLMLTAAHCLVDGEETLTSTTGARLPLSKGLALAWPAAAEKGAQSPSWSSSHPITVALAPEDISLPPDSKFANPSFNNRIASAQGRGDLALVRLRTPVPPKQPLAKLTELSVAKQISEGSRIRPELLLMGFGVTEHQRNDAGVLRMGRLKAIASENPGEFLAPLLATRPKPRLVKGTLVAGCFCSPMHPLRWNSWAS